ncbi:MAG: hypothetical protein HFG82_05530 [Dorea sp.]|nr:hypothetical protein [Dorea sp.]
MRTKILIIISTVMGVFAGVLSVKKVMSSKVQELKSMAEKHLSLFLMMNQWVKIKQEGKQLSHYLEKQGYKQVAIYGMSYAGETLVDELKASAIQITYAIDKNAGAIYEDVNIVSPEEDLEKVDAIIVTSITFYDEIKENLSKKISVPILSLEDLLYEI